MDSKALKFVLIVAIFSMLLPLGLIALLLISGTPSATGREAEQVDSDTPDDSANFAQDPTLDEDINPDGTTLPTNHPSRRNDGGPVQGPPSQSSDDDTPRYTVKNPASLEPEDPESEEQFDRLIAAAHDNLWDSALGQAEKDVPAEDRYCWNMRTAIAASFSLRQEELSGLIHSDRFVNFPMICQPRH